MKVENESFNAKLYTISRTDLGCIHSFFKKYINTKIETLLTAEWRAIVLPNAHCHKIKSTHETRIGK